MCQWYICCCSYMLLLLYSFSEFLAFTDFLWLIHTCPAVPTFPGDMPFSCFHLNVLLIPWGGLIFKLLSQVNFFSCPMEQASQKAPKAVRICIEAKVDLPELLRGRLLCFSGSMQQVGKSGEVYLKHAILFSFSQRGRQRLFFFQVCIVEMEPSLFTSLCPFCLCILQRVYIWRAAWLLWR